MTGVVSPVPRDAWRDVYASDPHALLYHAPEWVDLLCSTGSYEDASRLYELPGDRLAVLPMVRTHAPRGLRREASFPLGWGMGGLLAPGGVRSSDLAAVFADLDSRRVAQISLRPDPLTGSAWNAARPRRALTVPRLAHVLDLEGGFEHIWSKRFTGAARTAVRKAERSGLRVECDTTGRLLPVHYHLFDRSIDRWAAQQHEPRALARWRAHRRDPLTKLTAMAKHLAGGCRLWLAWLDGQPAASIIVIQGRNANIARGAMDKDLAGPTRANYLLHRLAIEDACSAGCHYYHMGESGASQPLAQFKTRFGARPYRSAEYHLEKVPVTATDRALRSAVKRMIGFTDAPPAAQSASQ
ncbi:MAG TPA: GNAT family N-acetyltransferase [Solirubrobacteraceae bacterium]|nr:GNAT family N-acetyltransferase [Solirubrobacteraceae bacterium]